MTDPTKKQWLRTLAVVAVTAAIVAPGAVLAADRFSDVPDSNVFSADIEWLADTGITTGCGGDKYCPDLAVTREQMAAFLHRLATNRVVDAATAVTAEEADHAGDASTLGGKPASAFLGVSATAANSAELGGATSSELVPMLSAEADGVTGAIAASGQVETNSVTIVAPEAGVLIISGTCFIDAESDTATFILRTTVDGANVGLAGWSALFKPNSTTQDFELSYTVAEEVDAGTHTVAQFAGPIAGTASFIHNHETLTVLFVPTGQASFSTTSAPAGATLIDSETGVD